jgi:hypothetical protein
MDDMTVKVSRGIGWLLFLGGAAELLAVGTAVVVEDV